MSKVPKIGNSNIFAIERKDIATDFVFYCDAKLLGGYAQKWARPFRSRDSKIRCISQII